MWLVWLSPVPLATLGAVAWTTWSNRTRRPQRTDDAVAAYERFRAALGAPAVPAASSPTARPAAAHGPLSPPDRSAFCSAEPPDGSAGDAGATN